MFRSISHPGPSRMLMRRMLHPAKKRDQFISSAQNERVKLFKSVKTSQHVRKKTGLRIFEGFNLINDGIQNHLFPKELFMSEKTYQSKNGDALLKRIRSLPNSPVKPCVVSDDIMSSLCETVNSQEVLALFSVPDYDSTVGRDLYIRARETQMGFEHAVPMILICDHVSDPGNFGTLVRSSLGFGANTVVAIGGCDPWGPKSIRACMGTCLRLPIYNCTTWTQYFDNIFFKEEALLKRADKIPITKKQFNIFVAETPDAHNELETDHKITLLKSHIAPYDQVDYTQPFALVIGSEANGISKELYKALIEYADNTNRPSDFPMANVIHVQIPMSVSNMDSYNAGVAGSVILSEAARQRRVEAKKRAGHAIINDEQHYYFNKY